jgi:hypothetical protein
VPHLLLVLVLQAAFTVGGTRAQLLTSAHTRLASTKQGHISEEVLDDMRQKANAKIAAFIETAKERQQASVIAYNCTI